MIQAQLIFQHNETGQVWDISTVTKSVSFKTKRSGTPSSLEIECVSDLAFPYGSPLMFKANGKALFYSPAENTLDFSHEMNRLQLLPKFC